MADISTEIAAFQNAVYGEEVRGSMISLAEKLNGVCEDNETAISEYESTITEAIADANEAADDASNAASSATSAASSASSAATAANTAATNAANAASTAEVTNSSMLSAEAARQTAETARATAETARQSAENSRNTAETARANAETNRFNNEATRQESESARITSENTRISQEATRQAQETQRQSAETQRVGAESSRATAFSAIQAAWADMEQQVLPPATYTTLGGVIVDQESGLEIDNNGLLSFTAGDFLTESDAASTYATITSVDGKANANHTHSASDVTEGTLAVARGGTGVTTAAAERERLGLGSTTDALPVANGGTGATTAANARAALDVYSTGEVDTALSGKANSSHNHSASDITNGALAIARGGTGASNIADARANLNVVGCGDQGGLNAMLSALGGAHQLYAIWVNTDNSANTDYNGKRTGLLVYDNGIAVYNNTDSNTIWKYDVGNTTSTTTVSNVITAASGITVTGVMYTQWNKIAMLSVTCKGFASTTGASQTIGTIVSGKRPTQQAYGNAATMYATYCYVNASGEIGVYWNTAPTSTTTYTFKFMYILA